VAGQALIDLLLLAVRLVLREEQAPDSGPNPGAPRGSAGRAAMLPGTGVLPGTGMLGTGLFLVLAVLMVTQ
jgi:hypothetical protein